MTRVKNVPYLFTESGLAALSSFVDRKALFAFDFDGTLVPIASDPEKIRVSEEIQNGLGLLMSRAVVAIITGRSRGDTQARLGITPQFLIGNHGAEGLPGWEVREREFARICLAWERQLREILPPAELSGIRIENKGITVSVHYRAAGRKEKAHSLILGGIGLLVPHPRRIPGKYVENLLPQTAPDKGTAMLLLLHLSGCSKGFYAGDDATDENVFRLDEDRLFTVRVGNRGVSQARYKLRSQPEIARLLREINHRLLPPAP